MEQTHTQKTQMEQTGFRCCNPSCRQWVSDQAYCGPVGHAPQNLCLECWLVHWEIVEKRACNGGCWTRMDQVLWLVCSGVERRQAARLVGKHCDYIKACFERLRRSPRKLPQWLVQVACRTGWVIVD